MKNALFAGCRIVILLIPCIGLGSLTAHATTLSVAGLGGATNNIEASIGDTVEAGAYVEIYTDLYAWQFDLHWNPAVVALATDVEGTALSRIGPTFFIAGTIDNDDGVLVASADTLISAAAGVNGREDPLAFFRFIVIGSGATAIDLENVTLLNSNLNSLSTDTVPLLVTSGIVPEPSSAFLVWGGAAALLFLSGVRRLWRPNEG